MADSIHVRGEGGTIITMDLPLPSHIEQRLIKGQIHRVNADGSPYHVIEAAPPGPVQGPPLTQPPKNAAKEQWVGWAVVNGADPEAAEGMNKSDLVEKYGTPQPGE